ncbi:MAG: orotidine 5'-phosphate decarboxylase, partial [Silvanigrellaceae bacterium]|nr:orotidine 5'-phosphate decarboxylase [Silvanigrellaceae bacterium]
ILKLQLAFFLSYGSKGIALLEEFVQYFQDSYKIILDGKFNEIETSLQGYLEFCFKTLKVQGVTINPFLGEKTIQQTFETCYKFAGNEGRVYVLCATSETGQKSMSFIKDHWQKIIRACMEAREDVFGINSRDVKLPGVVIGANRP